MEENDKTYMWLMIIAFVALLLATGLALAELGELKQPLPSVDKFYE